MFVDGGSGTTGLKIHERLSLYNEIELLSIDYDKRRDPKERSKYMNEADLVFYVFQMMRKASCYFD